MRILRLWGLTVLGLLFVSLTFAQSPADSLTAEQVKAIKDTLSTMEKVDVFWEIGKYFIPIFTLLVSFLGAYAFYRKRVNDWADRQIDERLKKEYGIDWGVLKSMVEEKSKVSKIKIAVLNAKTGKKKDLSDLLANAGFLNPDFFTFENIPSKKHFFSNAFDSTQFNYLLIDNEDGLMNENDIAEKVLDGHKAAFGDKILWFSPNPLEKFKDHSNKVLIVQLKERIVSTIKSKL